MIHFPLVTHFLLPKSFKGNSMCSWGNRHIEKLPFKENLSFYWLIIIIFWKDEWTSQILWNLCLIVLGTTFRWHPLSGTIFKHPKLCHKGTVYCIGKLNYGLNIRALSPWTEFFNKPLQVDDFSSVVGCYTILVINYVINQ